MNSIEVVVLAGTALTRYYTDDAVCDICHELGELRPYGLHGEEICFNCGMSDKDRTIEGYVRFLGF